MTQSSRTVTEQEKALQARVEELEYENSVLKNMLAARSDPLKGEVPAEIIDLDMTKAPDEDESPIPDAI